MERRRRGDVTDVELRRAEAGGARALCVIASCARMGTSLQKMLLRLASFASLLPKSRRLSFQTGSFVYALAEYFLISYMMVGTGTRSLPKSDGWSKAFPITSWKRW